MPALPKILLVDDHPPNLLALEAVLDGIGADFVRATSGDEALRRLLDHEFALVLLDVQMPGLDGFETAALIRARSANRGTPIIFLTAIHRDPSQHLRGYAQGAVDYLLKPFDAHVLRSKVQVFLELFHARERIREQEQLLLEKERLLWERRTQQRYRDLTDAMPTAIWAAQPDGRIYYFNRAFLDYAGPVGTDVTQERFLSLVHEGDRFETMRRRAQAMADGLSCETTFRLRARDGSHRTFLERIYVERDEQQQITGIIGTLIDIDDLRRASEEKDAFLAAATHELRTPVAASQAVLQLALRRLAAGRSIDPHEILDTVQGQMRRLGKLVDDLLDAARLSRGALPLEVEEFDLCALVGTVRDRFATLDPARDISVDGARELAIEGDPGRLDQVITNLLSNALRYSPAATPIAISVEEQGGNAIVAVRDHGVGIPKEKQRAIFARFARAHGTRYGGLGLGLDIALGIVRQHGGDILVESDGVEGRGSIFRVSLPTRQTPRPPEREGDGGAA